MVTLRPWIIVGWMLAAAGAFAQGTVQFNTRIPGVVDAPVSWPHGVAPGPGWSAELVKVEPNGTIIPIPQSLTTFRDDPLSLGLGRYVVPISTVEIPGTSPGGTVTLRLRAFLAAYGSYDAAGSATLPFPLVPCRTQSADFVVSGLGGGILPPAILTGLTGTYIPLNAFCVPEPSPFAFMVFGAFSMLSKALRRI